MTLEDNSTTNLVGGVEKRYGPTNAFSPLISICIPTYNRGYCISNAIESAVDALDDETEILIVDNASRDNTQFVIDRIGHSAIRNVYFDSTVSMYANHNRCSELARGEWVLFLHSDDTLRNDAITLIRKHIERESEIDLIFPTSSLHRTVNQTEPIFLDSERGVRFFCRFPAGTPSGSVYKRQSLLTCGFPTDLVAADLSLILNWFFRSFSCVVTSDEIVKIAHNDFQFSSSWVKSGRNIHDVGLVVKDIFGHRSEWLVNHVGPDMNYWMPFEIARFLMYLAHAGMFGTINAIEQQLTDKTYRIDRHYKHVTIGRIIGCKMLWNAVVASKRFSSLIRNTRI